MNGTDKKILVDEVVLCAARVWKQVSAPVTYKQSHHINGAWVLVTIEFDQTRQGEKPKRRAGDEDK